MKNRFRGGLHTLSLAPMPVILSFFGGNVVLAATVLVCVLFFACFFVFGALMLVRRSLADEAMPGDSCGIETVSAYSDACAVLADDAAETAADETAETVISPASE